MLVEGSFVQLIKQPHTTYQSNGLTARGMLRDGELQSLL